MITGCLSQLEEFNTTQNSVIDQQKSEISALKSEIEALKSTMQSDSSATTLLRPEVQELKYTISEMKSAAVMMEETIPGVLAQVASIQLALSRAETAFVEIQKKRSGVQIDLDKSLNENTTLRGQLESLNAEKEGIRKQEKVLSEFADNIAEYAKQCLAGRKDKAPSSHPHTATSTDPPSGAAAGAWHGAAAQGSLSYTPSATSADPAPDTTAFPQSDAQL